MKNLDISQKEQVSDMHHQGIGIDPQVILSLLIKKWYFFLIAIVIAYIGIRFYLGHTMPVYLSSTTILINETSGTQYGSNDELLQGLGLPQGMRNLENQVLILTSRDLTEEALRELPFEVELYRKTVKNKIPVYPEMPIRIQSDSELPIPKNIEFSINYLGDKKFILESESEGYYFKKEATFGEDIDISEGKFRIECMNEGWFKSSSNQKLYLLVHRNIDLIRYFNGRLNVESMSRGGSLLMVSIQGTNIAQDVDFLNKLAEVFQAMSLDKKNAEAVRRIQFIDDQIVGISDSLSTTENKLQRFRSTNRVMDLSAQGQAIISQVNLLENEKARLNLEANYYDYLADYLAKDVSKEVPIIPITMGITDQGLTTLVTELASLQGQVLARGAGEMNPLQGLLAQKVRSTKEALLETLNGLRRANSLARSENEEQINKVNRQAATLPVTERQLLGIERKFRLNDELYTFLLETRANQQMQKASNTADSEVIDPADIKYSTIVSPNPIKVTFIGLFAGFVIPLILLYLKFLLNKQIKEEDIQKMSAIPVVGNIPHNEEKSITVALNYPNSTIAEAFRLLRSRMQFITKEAKNPIILITSSMPEDGKTFTSINLASVYSLLGKKTVLVGFDLRRPRISQNFNIDNDKGVSTWLIGKDKFEDITYKTSFDNLFVIPAGPIPPNPSELIALEKTEEFLKLLKENYEYIIIDSSPIGIVSDTYHLASLTDVCLLVVRPGKTLRKILEATLREINLSSTKGVSLIINDIKYDNKQNAFGEKYGYTNDKKKTIKSFFKIGGK
jgi:tyrosine-protein kinase Etk/Wzc